MKVAYITPLGGGLYLIAPVSMDHIDHDLPGMPGAHPGHPLPGQPGLPGHPLPRPPAFPDNSLPTTPPPMVPPGTTLVLVRTPDGKWHWATTQMPPTTLPEPPTAQPKA
jgi:hypothetical protein